MSETKNNQGIKFSTKAIIGAPVTINDLREKEYEGENLAPYEYLALRNFDRYRVNLLNKQTGDSDFRSTYQKLQVWANLSPFTDFLKEEYSSEI